MWVEGTRETITKVPENPGVVLRNFAPRLSFSVPHVYSPWSAWKLKIIRNVYSPSKQPGSVWTVCCLEVIDVHRPYYAGPCFNCRKSEGQSSANTVSIISIYMDLCASFTILYYNQQMHNYFTNYHTPTCFDTIVSSYYASGQHDNSINIQTVYTALYRLTSWEL